MKKYLILLVMFLMAYLANAQGSFNQELQENAIIGACIIIIGIITYNSFKALKR